MFGKIGVGAVLAGFGAGLIAALLHFAWVQPLLLQAELYETGALTHFGGGVMGHGADGHAHAHGMGTAFAGDLARNGLTVLFTALIYLGYALLLAAAMGLAAERGVRIDARRGLIWGAAGFVAVQLAPAMGLPPELPGMAAAEITPRRIWWALTVACTAAGLGLLAFGRGWAQWGPALGLLLLPHLVGAPHPHDLFGPTPPEVASQFAARVLGVGLVAWVCLGGLLGRVIPEAARAP